MHSNERELLALFMHASASITDAVRGLDKATDAMRKQYKNDFDELLR